MKEGRGADPSNPASNTSLFYRQVDFQRIELPTTVMRNGFEAVVSHYAENRAQHLHGFKLTQHPEGYMLSIPSDREGEDRLSVATLRHLNGFNQIKCRLFPRGIPYSEEFILPPDVRFACRQMRHGDYGFFCKRWLDNMTCIMVIDEVTYLKYFSGFPTAGGRFQDICLTDSSQFSDLVNLLNDYLVDSAYSLKPCPLIHSGKIIDELTLRALIRRVQEAIDKKVIQLNPELRRLGFLPPPQTCVEPNPLTLFSGWLSVESLSVSERDMVRDDSDSRLQLSDIFRRSAESGVYTLMSYFKDCWFEDVVEMHLDNPGLLEACFVRAKEARFVDVVFFFEVLMEQLGRVKEDGLNCLYTPNLYRLNQAVFFPAVVREDPEPACGPKHGK